MVRFANTILFRWLSLMMMAAVPGLAPMAAHAEAPLVVVAAENFYGDLAAQLGGPNVAVTSILSNPDEDPHLFEVTPRIGRAVSNARVIVLNGIDYDPWMQKLLAASGTQGKTILVVADLVGRRSGDNPHLWYDPATMPAYANALSAALAKADPANAADYAARLHRVLSSLAPIAGRAKALHARFAGLPVTANEPVFGEMAAAIGLDMRNERFQLAVMNDTEPSASDVAAMETDLRQHRVRLFLYNSQATDSAANRLRDIAARAGVPVVGVTETEPHGLDYQAWMLSELDAVEKALSSPALSPTPGAAPAPAH